MAIWSNPTDGSNYLDYPAEIKDRDVDLAVRFDSGTFSAIPTRTIRRNSTNSRFEIWATPTPAIWNEFGIQQ